jgi:hypothetical protein
VSRLCFTQSTTCTGIAPCEGCHNARAQVLVTALTAAGYTDRDRMQQFFAVMAGASRDVLQFVESQLAQAAAYAKAAEESLQPIEEPVPDTEFPPPVEETAPENGSQEQEEEDLMGPMDPSTFKKVMEEAKGNGDKPAAKKTRTTAKAQAEASTPDGDEQHG